MAYKEVFPYRTLTLKERVEKNRRQEAEKHAAFVKRHAPKEEVKDPNAGQQLSLF